jgi:hypothetical protein
MIGECADNLYALVSNVSVGFVRPLLGTQLNTNSFPLLRSGSGERGFGSISPVSFN